MPYAHGVTVTLLLETTDRHGDDTLTEVGTLTGCAWAPTTSTEDDNGRQQVIRGRTLYAPPSSGLTPQHRVRFPDNSVWRVDGEIGSWSSPFSGWAPGDEVHLERVTG